jgi:hypothetical protein
LLHEGAADKYGAGDRRWRRKEKYQHHGLVRDGAVGRDRATVTYCSSLFSDDDLGLQKESVIEHTHLKPLSEWGY